MSFTKKIEKLVLADTTDDELIGNKLIEVLQLKLKQNGRVDTSWGDKNPVGLAQVVKRIIQEKGNSPSK